MCGRACKQNACVPGRPPTHTTIFSQKPPRCGPASSPFSVSFSTSWEGTPCDMTSQAGFEEPSPTSQPWRPRRSCTSQKGEWTWVWDRAGASIPTFPLFPFSSDPVSKGGLETPFCLQQNEGHDSNCSSAVSPLGQRRPSSRAEQSRAGFRGSRLTAKELCLRILAFHLSLSI